MHTCHQLDSQLLHDPFSAVLARERCGERINLGEGRTEAGLGPKLADFVRNRKFLKHSGGKICKSEKTTQFHTNNQ